MAEGHDPATVDEEGVHEHPGAGDPVGGFESPAAGHGIDDPATDDHGHDAHDDHDHGHDDHGDHGPVGDAWVLPPLVIGLVIGLILAVIFGLASGVAALV